MHSPGPGSVLTGGDGWWGPCPGCPEKLWLSTPWQVSRPGWMELWAPWCGGRCPCWWQGGWNQMIFKVPSNPDHSMILWWLQANVRTHACKNTQPSHVSPDLVPKPGVTGEPPSILTSHWTQPSLSLH